MAIANQPPSVSSAQTVKSFEFPFQAGSTGFPQMADPVKAAFYQITSLLLTGKNERVMSPDYGVNVYSFVFENLTPITMARISANVTGAIETWVPGVRVLKVVPSVTKNEDGTNTTVLFDIFYRVANQSAHMQVPVQVGVVQPSV